jgi:hypothetical protein
VLRLNAVHIGIWTLFFAFLYSTQFIGPRHEGQTLEFWRQACSDGGHKGCRYLMTLLAERPKAADADDADDATRRPVQSGPRRKLSRTEFNLDSACAGQARALMHRVCDLGLTEACEKLGEGGISQQSR